MKGSRDQAARTSSRGRSALAALTAQQTGDKLAQKTYWRHSGYPGGIKSRTLGEMLERKPEEEGDGIDRHRIAACRSDEAALRAVAPVSSIQAAAALIRSTIGAIQPGQFQHLDVP